MNTRFLERRSKGNTVIETQVIHTYPISQTNFTENLDKIFMLLMDFCKEEVGVILATKVYWFHDYKNGWSELPFYEETVDEIYMSTYWFDKKYCLELSNYQGSCILAHEVGHAIQEYQWVLDKVKCFDHEKDIESQADYFSWWFMRYLSDLGITNRDNIDLIRSFLHVCWDKNWVHWSWSHRIDMFNRWFVSWNVNDFYSFLREII